MADFTITADQIGAYEIPIAAGATVVVAVAPKVVPGGSATDVQVLVHSGASPVYAKLGTTVSAKDQASTMIPSGSWSSVTLGASSLAITSAAAAVVSVYRP